MKTAQPIQQQPPVQNWSDLKHGAIRAFVDDRERTAPGGTLGDNLEHYQAFAVELNDLLRSFLIHGEGSNLSKRSQRLMPIPTKLTRHGIDKYLVRLKHWQQDVLSFEELETFVTAVFVWS
ncbi:MAG: hypothetical protein QOI07_889 [Verrucomicrobiota bacterium]|jgi:hypothetical protein